MPPAYRLSLTAASLLPDDMALLAQTYLASGDWTATRAAALEQNLLKTAKVSSAKRRYQELELRLRQLDEAQLEALASGDATARRLLSFVACCRAYPFLARFVTGGLRRKVDTYQLDVHEGDYHRHFENEALGEPRLEEISDRTADKMQSRTMALLREAGLLEGTRLVVPYLSMGLRQALGEGAPYVFS